MPRDITVKFSDGSSHVYQGAPDDITPEMVTERASKEFGKEVAALDGGRQAPADTPVEPSSTMETLKVLDKIVRGGGLALPNFARMMYDVTTAKQKDVDANGSLYEKALSLSAPGGAVNRMVQAVPGVPEFQKKLGEWMTPSEPETETGKAIGNVGESIVGTFAGPGGMAKPLQSLAIGAGSGVGAELGGRLTEDNSPIARVLGALIGGGVPAIAAAAKPNAEKLIRQATEQVDAKGWGNAKMMQQVADEANLPTLSSQFLGTGSTLDDLMAAVATHPSIRPKLLSRMEDAPEAVRRSLEVWKNENLPISVDDTRTVLGDLQSAAAGKERSILNKANAAYTDALPPGVSEDLYSPEHVRGIASMIRARAADPNFHGELAAGPFMERIATEIEGTLKKGKLLNAAGEAMELPVQKGVINNLLKSINAKAEKEGFSGLAEKDLKEIIKEGTPEFAAAREAKSEVMKGELTDFQKGLAGQISQMGGGVRPDKFTARETALNWVFSKTSAHPDALRQMADQMGPEFTQTLLREHISRSMNNALKLTGKGGNMQQPFEFVRELAGTGAQATNFREMLAIAARAHGAKAPAVENGFLKLIKTLESYADVKIPASVDKATLEQMAGENAFGYLIAPQSRIARSIWLKQTKRTFEKIADIVTSPDGLKQLEAIANSRDPSVLGRYAQSLLAEAGKVRTEAEGSD